MPPEPDAPAPPPPSGVPRIIWMLWLQGWDKAPAVARACRTTWEERNPGWEVRALSNLSLRDHVDLPELFPHAAARWMSAAHFADLARLALLREHGGLWVDATVYCTRPLDGWLGTQTGEGFFAFSLHEPKRRVIANWFLAAERGHRFVKRWAELADAYWARRDAPEDYFWAHVLFADLYRFDPATRASWDRVPRLSGRDAHHFAPYPDDLLRTLATDDLPWVNGDATPLLKLTHRLGPGEPPSDSVIAHLCAEAERLRSPRQTMPR